MEKHIQLTDCAAFECSPDEGVPKAGVVVLQEIFGVNDHIRDNTRRYAKAGYTALAPQLFDPAEKDAELGYSKDDMKRGMDLRAKVGNEKALECVQQAIDELRKKHDKVYVVGYCWGGSLAFLAATRLKGVTKASAYYGSMVYDHRDEKPKCPVMFHFGKKDQGIAMEKVEAVGKAQPGAPLYVYDAGHGFNSYPKNEFDYPSASLAEQRTREFFA